MTRTRPRGATLIAALLVVSGCGSDSKPRPLPQKDAAFLLTQLDEVDRRVEARACGDVKRGTLTRIENRVDNLPDDVDQDVQSALSDSVQNLRGLVEDQCRPKRKPKPAIPLPTTTTTPETTTTQPETTTTEPETTTEETPTPDEGGDEKGNGGAGAGGNGDGGGAGKGNGKGGGAALPGGGGGGAAAPPGGTVTPGDALAGGEADG
jgi:hypothetical protein